MARKPVAHPPAPPPLVQPPATPEEVASTTRQAQMLKAIVAICRRRNLDSAVRVAQAVAAGRLPELEAHFSELGRRFAPLLEQPAPADTRRATFQVIEGGRQ